MLVLIGVVTTIFEGNNVVDLRSDHHSPMTQTLLAKAVIAAPDALAILNTSATGLTTAFRTVTFIAIAIGLVRGAIARSIADEFAAAGMPAGFGW
ncbi:MAG: hypothetical protein WC023_01970 [Rhodocyclaceae bacterium]